MVLIRCCFVLYCCKNNVAQKLKHGKQLGIYRQSTSLLSSSISCVSQCSAWGIAAIYGFITISITSSILATRNWSDCSRIYAISESGTLTIFAAATVSTPSSTLSTGNWTGSVRTTADTRKITSWISSAARIRITRGYRIIANTAVWEAGFIVRRPADCVRLPSFVVLQLLVWNRLIDTGWLVDSLAELCNCIAKFSYMMSVICMWYECIVAKTQLTPFSHKSSEVSYF